MDDIDRANEINARHTAESLAVHQARLATTGPSLEFCDDCGDEIPAARRLAQPGCNRCIDCQTEFEKGDR